MAKTSWRAIAKAIVAMGALTLVIFILFDTVTMLYGISIVLPEVGNASYPLYLVAPTLIVMVDISGTALQGYYIFLVIAIVASVVWLLWKSVPNFIEEISMRAPSRKHSAILDLCMLMFAIIFMNFAIVFLMLLAGYNPTDAVGDADLWELLFLLANASVWEEIVSRVLLIGIPLLLYDYMWKRLRTKKHTYILGGGFELGIPETCLLVASSVFFGFAHYEGWGSWKVFPAAVAGVAFGYMFLRHGLASAIALHFAFDYLSIPGDVFGDSVAMLTIILTLIWVAMGLACFIYFLTRIGEFVTGSKYLEPFVPPPTPVWFTRPRPYIDPNLGNQQHAEPYERSEPARTSLGHGQQYGDQNPVGGYVCPVCGNTQARWANGRFQCLRCGSLL